MAKEKLAAASELIKEKHYAEARAILKTIDHPTATEWLKKLDAVAPEKKRSSNKTLTLLALFIALCAVFLFVILSTLLLRNNISSNSSIVLSSNSQNSTPTLLNSENLLEQPISFGGLQLQLPQGWTLSPELGDATPTLNTIILFSSPESIEQLQQDENSNFDRTFRQFIENGNEIIILVVERDLRDDESIMTITEEAQSRIAENGFNGATSITSDITEIRINSRPAASFDYRFAGTTAKFITVDVGSNNAITFSGISENSDQFYPLLIQFIDSVTFDESQAGDFACPVKRWLDGGALVYITDFGEQISNTFSLVNSPYISSPYDSLGTGISMLGYDLNNFRETFYPECAREIYINVINGMTSVINGMNYAHGNNVPIPITDSVEVRSHFDAAEQYFTSANERIWDFAFIYNSLLANPGNYFQED
ncbi:MAG: hypothetical protein IAE89_02140 [Anaerolineae bacterium]|nr:hypothetical protein [Anaerolineae bacterium]